MVTVWQGLGLQVDVFAEMVSLRALHLDNLTWEIVICVELDPRPVLSRLRSLTNLEEMSLSVGACFVDGFVDWSRPSWRCQCGREGGRERGIADTAGVATGRGREWGIAGITGVAIRGTEGALLHAEDGLVMICWGRTFEPP